MFDYTARPDLLKDRVILITGAGRGIGAAAAKSFAAHGATVLLLGKTEANLSEVYD
jgi:NAD(P)-dependent dehydrogenase (short-subunit alcohol dehydrogenase family)